MLSRQLVLGLFLTCICMGLTLIFFVVIVMTPDFEMRWKVAIPFIILAIGFFYGCHEIEQVDKVLQRLDKEALEKESIELDEDRDQYIYGSDGRKPLEFKDQRS